MRVALKTIGCKLNQFETEFIRETFEKHGCKIVDFSEEADVYVINTCTVTSNADSKARQSIRQARKKNPSAVVVAVGCYPQVYQDDVEKLDVDVIVGVSHKHRIYEIVLDALSGKRKIKKVGDIGSEFVPMSINRFEGYSRAFVKIQDGCDHRCSYCVVWKARGPSRSASLSYVLDEVRRLLDAGFEEIVLTGTNLSDYNHDGVDLVQLVEKITKIDGLKKVRLSSIEPNYITRRFLEFVRDNDKVCRHLHIPVQSASTRILRLMNRSYDEAFLRRMFDMIFNYFDDMGVGVDIIVGFPTETDEDFEKTYELLNEYPVYYMHIFSFSPRPGTVAYEIKPRVRPDIIRKRWEVMNSLKAKKKREFVGKFWGKRITGVIEARPVDDVFWSGISDNYIPLMIEGKVSNSLYGKVRLFEVLKPVDDKLIVKLV